MDLEWRARDDRYKGCGAFIDTAEESIDARFSCRALGLCVPLQPTT
jgi:hypothetical protein